MRISEIIKREEYLLSEVDDNLEFREIKIDASALDIGDLLFVLSSDKLPDFDKLKVLPLAVVCDAKTVLPDFLSLIRVENPRLAWANACMRYEKFSPCDMKIIGVTGTNGKTTTASLIKHILSSLGHKVGFIGTGKIQIDREVISGESYSMTTPDPPLLYKSLRQMSEQGCDVVVMEVSSHALALNKLAPLEFDYGIFTNLSSEHMDFHTDMESYFSAKLKLFKSCKCSLFNIDDEYGRRAYALCDGKKISAGILWRGDVWACNIEKRALSGIDYIYHGRDFSFKMALPLPGIYNAYNSMLAAAVCIDMGCKPCEVKKALKSAPTVDGRFEVINDKISVIIDYAHTPFAFESILKEISNNKKGCRLTVVFGCGGDRDKTKRPKMAEIAEGYADRIILTADNSRSESTRDIIADIIRGFKKGRYEIKENRAEAIRSAILDACDGDIVAIIGKGPEKYNIDSAGYHPFNEKEIIGSALRERGDCRCE